LKFTNKFRSPDNGKSDNPIQVLSAVEYFDSLFDADLKSIDQFKEIGISSIILTDGPNDRLAENKNGGKKLGDFGKTIIQKLNDVGIVVDITHLSGAMQLEVIKASRKPVIASHSNVRGVVDVARNLSDEVLSELTRKMGMVLLTSDKEYLMGRESAAGASGIAKLIEHIDYVVKKYGIDHVGIGTDYGGSGGNAPPDLFGVECFRSIANTLIKNGYSPEHVKKIMGGNLIDFFSAAEENSI
jgi:membrane dipeptidase